ncbi:hypothetical protein HPO96_05310 [Kribbella sandramycini]|uniref:Uncharacterized protein n=1 Tax=Kribbella sandramycini TaxID=60450 RepID=A0A7Y4KVU1_9ACTN|nr:hypothetical protein [Kribbella sandramycini]MBB6567745.1 hypothetical protein [Kribbella sandramycini]NOL39659.1 hypothetical protein [Kribbella sandramycini]
MRGAVKSTTGLVMMATITAMIPVTIATLPAAGLAQKAVENHRERPAEAIGSRLETLYEWPGRIWTP